METPGNNDSQTATESSLLAHLLELRRRLLISIVTILVVFVALVPFANRLFHLIAIPMIRRLPAGSSMIATEVASPFLTPFKLAFIAAIFLSVPVLLYQVWAFIAPGLYKRERRMVVPLLVSSTLLFYLGAAFAYFVVFPMVFAFFTASAPQGVTVMTDISKYLDFVLTLFFAFGVAFEVPVAEVLLVWTGFTTPGTMAKARPYVLVCVFIVGMLLTPPDVFSQSMLAVPMYGLFELGIIAARVMVPGSREVDAQKREQE